MYISHILPNGKEVRLKEIFFKDLRTFNLYEEASISGRLNFLESFILTKGLNIIEKIHSLFYLRLQCIGDNIVIGSDKGDVGISLEFLIKNIGGINNLKRTVTIDKVDYTLDYPLNFNIGDDDFLLSMITKIKIEGDELNLGKLSEDEYLKVIERLPKELYSHIDAFLMDNRNFFDITLLDERKNLQIQPIKFNLLEPGLIHFIVSLFNCVDVKGYRDLLFILSKRFNDVNFLLNCTYVELNDYFEMYKSEIEQQSNSNQS